MRSRPHLLEFTKAFDEADEIEENYSDYELEEGTSTIVKIAWLQHWDR